jgi:hypothetical protein
MELGEKMIQEVQKIINISLLKIPRNFYWKKILKILLYFKKIPGHPLITLSTQINITRKY